MGKEAINVNSELHTHQKVRCFECGLNPSIYNGASHVADYYGWVFFGGEIIGKRWERAIKVGNLILTFTGRSTSIIPCSPLIFDAIVSTPQLREAP